MTAGTTAVPRFESAGDSDGAADASHCYGVYGIAIVSDVPLDLPQYEAGGLGNVECRTASASAFEEAAQTAADDRGAAPWHRVASLADGSTYVSWDRVGEFIVSADGRRITCRRASGSSLESFQVYMLGQALSFALVKQGFEPLHATAVVVDGGAVAFLGESGFGKSSLAACFLEAGCRLLTDDLLVLQRSSAQVFAFPGPPRIKLFPQIARRFLGGDFSPVPMNGGTGKLILPISDRLRCAVPVPITALFAVEAPRDACRRDHVSIEPLSPRGAFIQLVKSTFNRRLVTASRLQRQLQIMADVAGDVPVATLSYPRSVDRLADVRQAVFERVASCAMTRVV
jgi:hypothetical protein